MIAGWTGRDVAALEHHIEELKAIGVQPPSPDWGLQISEARNFFQIAPWVLLFPACVIALLVICFALVGKVPPTVDGAKQRAAENARRDELLKLEREREAALAEAKSHEERADRKSVV
mgnify:CR=1 FL=1